MSEDEKAISTATSIIDELERNFYYCPADIAALRHVLKLASVKPILDKVADYPCTPNDICQECQYNQDNGLYCVSGRAKDALSQINKVMLFLENKEKENQHHDKD